MGAPHARKWKVGKAHPCGVTEYRRSLDALTIYNVMWTPYTDHRVHREFDDSSLYLGICDGRPQSLDTCLRGVCNIMVIFRASHNHFQIFHKQVFIGGLRITSLALVVPLEIMVTCSAIMVTCSGISLYNTLALSHRF